MVSALICQTKRLAINIGLLWETSLKDLLFFEGFKQWDGPCNDLQSWATGK